MTNAAPASRTSAIENKIRRRTGNHMDLMQSTGEDAVKRTRFGIDGGNFGR